MGLGFSAMRVRLRLMLIRLGFFARAGGRGFGSGGFGVGGRSLCRVAAFGVSGLPVLAIFFITFSHCAWRHVISLSKATKKRSKENAFKTRAHKCPQRAASILRYPKSTVLARAPDV